MDEEGDGIGMSDPLEDRPRRTGTVHPGLGSGE